MARSTTTRKAQTGAKDSRPTVVITGIAGRLGRELARRLHRTHQVIGIDRRPAPGLPRDVHHFRVDLRRNRCEQIFRERRIEGVFHMGVLHDPRKPSREHHEFNIVGLQRLLGHVRKYNVRKLVVLSTADVYGPAAENVTFLTEEAPLLAASRFEGIRDLVTVDMAALSFMWQHPELETVVLRPVHIVGSVRNAPMTYLERPWVPVPMGFDPMVQLVHQDDVVRAMLLATQRGVRGVFNIDGPTAVPVSVVLREAGIRRVPLPDFALRKGLERMWRLRLTRFPPPEIDHIQWPATVDGTRARKILGYSPRHDLAAIFHMLREGDPLLAT